ncbi:MAG: hypothetical protein ACOX7X_04945 [Methanosarcina flavescens]|uniref:hypothetical protein n=1 Tax=Methanosarcina flavescens TaxID=1715806 RepID=UPI0006C74E8F|nr:hypothetical protein [Methanosarcina flavescens]
MLHFCIRKLKFRYEVSSKVTASGIRIGRFYVSIRQAIKISFGSIGGAKLRSALTTLGIIIGIAAVAANVSLEESFKVLFEQEISVQGSNFGL